MVLNGYGKYRVHQVEIEWTPEWESAYQKILERHESFWPNFMAGVWKGLKRAFIWIGLSLASLILGWWTDMGWLEIVGLISLAGACYRFGFYIGLDEVVKDKKTLEGLVWAYAELFLLRTLTHDSIEIVTRKESDTGDVRGESWDIGHKFDGVRMRLQEQGSPITAQYLGWLEGDMRERLIDHATRRLLVGQGRVPAADLASQVGD